MAEWIIEPVNDLYPYGETFDYQFMFSFEANCNCSAKTVSMLTGWRYSILIAAIYVLTIFSVKHLMRNRPAMEWLKKPLVIWNFGLALFSIIGTVRMAPELGFVLFTKGWKDSVCVPSFLNSRVSCFWAELFALSKVLELGDTMFVVLRKRQLTFLHWYHHITVLVYTWHACHQHTANGRWFMLMNFIVHSFMYSYYCASALGKRFPKCIPMSITCMQISQMLMGCVAGGYAYWIKWNGGDCHQTFTNLYFCAAIYFSYFLLFVRFFYAAYFARGGKHAKPDVAEQKKRDGMHNELSNGIQNGTVHKDALNGHLVNGSVETSVRRRIG